MQKRKCILGLNNFDTILKIQPTLQLLEPLFHDFGFKNEPEVV